MLPVSAVSLPGVAGRAETAAALSVHGSCGDALRSGRVADVHHPHARRSLQQGKQS